MCIRDSSINAFINFVEELKWRGMIHDIMPGTEKLLEKEKISGYIGFDPTADSLHIGHMVQVMLLVHFQRSGHTPIALVGGATGMIGDPSGKSEERNLLDEVSLRKNEEAIKRQLSKFLDFQSDSGNRAIMVNNYDWMKEYSFLGFIRDIGKYITVNYMMSKDSVKKRIGSEAKEGMSFTEFSYHLICFISFGLMFLMKMQQNILKSLPFCLKKRLILSFLSIQKHLMSVYFRKSLLRR